MFMLNDLLIKYLSNQVDTNTSDIQNIKNSDVYSTSEVNTNKIWINGKTIYRKVLTGKLGSYNNQEIVFYWRSNGNLYEMHNYDYCNNKDYTIVLEYTKKTTD